MYYIYYRINTGDFNVLINSLFNADALCICKGVVNFSLQIASNSIRACITADGNVLTSSRYFAAQLSSKLSVLHFVSISWIFDRFISQSKCCLLYRPILNYILHYKRHVILNICQRYLLSSKFCNSWVFGMKHGLN